MNYKDSENLKQVREQQQKRRQQCLLWIDLLSLLISFDKTTSSLCFMVVDMLLTKVLHVKNLFLNLGQF